MRFGLLIVDCSVVEAESSETKFISFCDLFKIQVSVNPRLIAATFEDTSLTYEELGFRANKLANFLKANGVGPEVIVGLCLHNSLDLLVGILGILQAGGAYMPIDPQYPVERIEAMLADAMPRLILSEEGLNHKFTLQSQNIVPINKLPETDPIFLGEAVRPDQLAYVVYTSGSTGKPKGILIEHKALTYAAQTHQNLFSANLTSLVSGSISFDASLLVIANTLISGGKVCFPKSGIAVDPEQIISLIDKEKISYTLCVPSFYSMILDKSRNMPFLKRIDLGGENIPNSIPDIHSKIAPNAVLHNVYGPSEYAVGATFAKIYDPTTKEISKITIGKPFKDTQVYILDENLEQVAVGVKGEIFIGGPGLARGYLNKEMLTKEKFLSLSLVKGNPIRVFRTGDYGRVLPDGNIEFIGRMDHQVKIRGFRVELGEIEYSICQFPGINEAVVISREESGGRMRLVAYFSALSGEDVTAKLRNYLNSILPHYMVPISFVQVKEWPRTPNGKIDRAALPKFSGSSALSSLFKKPQQGLEEKLYQVWKVVLGRDTFGVDDNFSDLGGDSLQVACMQTKLKEVLDFEVSISDLYQYPTISQLAKQLSSKGTENCLVTNSQVVAKNQKSAFQRFKKFEREV